MLSLTAALTAFATLGTAVASPPAPPPLGAPERKEALLRARQARPGSPAFYYALGRPEIARDAEHRILTRWVAGTAGLALVSGGLVYFLYSMHDYQVSVYAGGSSRGGPSDGEMLATAAMVGVGAGLFTVGMFVRRDPLTRAEREELVRQFAAGLARAPLGPAPFFTRGGGGLALSGRF